MHIFVREKSFYKRFFPLLLVIALQSLASLMVNMVDNLMLGRYTELALSGATLVNQLQFMLQQVANGTGTGIVVLAAQYWGRGETGPIRRIISLGTKVSLAIGIVFFAATKLFPHPILALFTSDEAVIAEGMKYLEIMCWTYLIFSVSNTLMQSLRAVETAFIGTVMSCSTIAINLCLNYCLIYGNFGFPELGIVGAAIATLISRVVELVIILVYVLCIDKKLRMKVRDLLAFDLSFFGDYLRVAAPVMVSGAMWGVAQAAQTAILGHLSAAAIAANAIASIVFQVCAVFGMGAGNAASVTIGRTIGEGRLDMVKPYARTLQGIFVLLGLFSGALVFALRHWIVAFYTISEETRALTIGFLTVLSITTVGTCYEWPVEGGIIAGGGSTKYQAVVDNLFMWLFTIPAAALSAFVFRWPPLVTFSLLKADQLLKCIPNGIVCNRYRWIRVLTRDDAPQS